MSKAKQKQVAVPESTEMGLVPVAASDTRQIARRKPLTRRSAATFQERQYLDNLPELSEATYTALRDMLQAKNPVALKIAAEVLKLTRGDKVSVNVNQNTQVVQASNDGRKSFAQLVRRLEERDRVNATDIVIDAEEEQVA